MLVVRTKPKHDESYLGFLIRLTELNFYENSNWIIKEAGLNPKTLFGVCSFVFDADVDLAALAYLSGVAVDNLHELVYDPVDGRYRVKVFGQHLPRYFLRLRESRVCPECLRQSNYCRRQWDFAVVTACPTHQILLLEDCHKCGSKITWRRKKVGLCHCGADWRQAQMAPLQECDSAVSRLVHQKFGLMRVATTNTINNNPLYQLDLPSILEALFLIASQQKGRIDITGRSLLLRKKLLEIHDDLLRAFSVFECWPRNFHGFLDEVRSKSKRTNPGLHSNFGGVYRHLHVSGKLSRSLSQILRSEFEKYVSENWDDGYLAKSKWFQSNKGRYISQTKACQELNLHHRVIERFISDGKLKGVVRRTSGRRLFLVDAESVKKLKVDPDHYV